MFDNNVEIPFARRYEMVVELVKWLGYKFLAFLGT